MSLKNKLVVCIMGQNCERFIEMCLESVKEADAIVYCDGGSTDKTGEIVSLFRTTEAQGVDIIENTYNQNDKAMNGKQRNFYLNHLREHYFDYWALCLDADEVVEDLGAIKKFIEGEPGIYSVKMRHLIGDLAHEDSTVETHFVPNRLFKIEWAEKYPEVEHPVLQGLDMCIYGTYRGTTIWHLAYVPNMWEIKKRYDNHLAKSNMHTPEFLKGWYYQHLFGDYPRNKFDPIELPSIILNKFGINKDELYFANRTIEIKHPIMVKQWNEYFKPKTVLDLGAGRGVYLFFWRWFVGDSCGIELSEFAVKNAFVDQIVIGDISNPEMYRPQVNWDLITAIDVLEHLDDNQLLKTLDNMAKNGKNFIFSIPFIGDPNLTNDKTHKQFMSRSDWTRLIEAHGIKIEPTPANFLFKEQILIGRKI